MNRQGSCKAPRMASGVSECPVSGPGRARPLPCRRSTALRAPCPSPTPQRSRSEPQVEPSIVGNRNCRGKAESPTMLSQSRWVRGSAAAPGCGALEGLPLYPELVLEGGSRPSPSSPRRGQPSQRRATRREMLGPGLTSVPTSGLSHLCPQQTLLSDSPGKWRRRRHCPLLHLPQFLP